MFRTIRWVFPVLVMTGLLAVAVVKAEDAKATGTVAGTVVDKDGKAVAGVAVRVLPPMPARGQGKKLAEGDAPKRERPTAVAEGKTDEQGKFSIANVPAGEYTVFAGSRDKGMGRANVTVKANETVTVALTLEQRQGGGQGGQGGAGGAGRGNRGGAK